MQKCVYFSCDFRVHRYRCDRQPRKITEKRLRKKRRKLAGTYLVNNVPRSSTFHRITRRSLARKHKYRSYLAYAFKSKHFSKSVDEQVHVK